MEQTGSGCAARIHANLNFRLTKRYDPILKHLGNCLDSFYKRTASLNLARLIKALILAPCFTATRFMSGFDKAKSEVTLNMVFYPENISVYCRRAGPDLALHIYGGKEHIGAAAIAFPDGSVKVAQLYGHKEGELASYTAQILAAELHCVVAVSAGVHFDGLSAAGIKIIEDAWRKLAHDVIVREKQIRQKNFENARHNNAYELTQKLEGKLDD